MQISIDSKSLPQQVFYWWWYKKVMFLLLPQMVMSVHLTESLRCESWIDTHKQTSEQNGCNWAVPPACCSHQQHSCRSRGYRDPTGKDVLHLQPAQGGQLLCDLQICWGGPICAVEQLKSLVWELYTTWKVVGSAFGCWWGKKFLLHDWQFDSLRFWPAPSGVLDGGQWDIWDRLFWRLLFGAQYIRRETSWSGLEIQWACHVREQLKIWWYSGFKSHIPTKMKNDSFGISTFYRAWSSTLGGLLVILCVVVAIVIQRTNRWEKLSAVREREPPHTVNVKISCIALLLEILYALCIILYLHWWNKTRKTTLE